MGIVQACFKNMLIESTFARPLDILVQDLRYKLKSNRCSVEAFLCHTKFYTIDDATISIASTT